MIRGFISILGAKVGTLFLGLIITPLLVRLLGSSLYGDYAFILSILGITMILINAGISDGTRKYIAENRDYSGWPEVVFRFYFQVSIIMATIGAFVYLTLAWVDIPQLQFGPNFDTYIQLLAGLIFGRQVFAVSRSALMGLDLEGISEPLKIFQKVLFGVFALILVYLGYGVVGALLSHILASAVVSVLAFRILTNKLDIKAIVGRIPEDFPKRELLSFNILSIILIFLTASLYHIDILLLRSIAGSRSTGYYRAALMVAEFLWFVPNAIQTVFLYSSSELWSENEVGKISDLTSKTTRYNLILTVILTIGIAVLADSFVPLYFGREFKPAIKPLLLLLPGALGFALARPIFAVGQGKGALKPLILATGTSAVLNLVLNLVLIPVYGMSGAAVATSISYGSMVVFHSIVARRLGFDPIENLRLVRIVLVAILSSPIILLAEKIATPILSIITVPIIGFSIYSILTIKFGVLTEGEIDSLLKRIPDPISKYVSYILRI